jgi:hypothetical protein
VYGPAHDENKEHILSELSNICAPKKFTSPGGGDFNIIRYSDEKNKTSMQIGSLICSTGL